MSFNEMYARYLQFRENLIGGNDPVKENGKPTTTTTITEVTPQTIDTETIISIIELYNKAFNTYIVWKFRGGKPIQDEMALINLSNRVIHLMRDEGVAMTFKNKYIEDNMQIEKSMDREKVLFSLRQKTTKVIRYLLLKGLESRVHTSMLVELLNKKKDLISQNNKESDYTELMEKCELISTLFTSAPPKYTPIKITDKSDKFDYIRNLTNEAIANVAMNNPKSPESLRECFNAIDTELTKMKK
jgi:hypothetical protein